MTSLFQNFLQKNGRMLLHEVFQVELSFCVDAHMSQDTVGYSLKLQFFFTLLIICVYVLFFLLFHGCIIRIGMEDKRDPSKWFDGEDNEGKMATSQLHRLNDITGMLLDMLASDDQLPSWVQSKITRAYTDLNDVFGYLEPQVDSNMRRPPSVYMEGKRKKKKGLWDNVHARRKAGKRPKRPGEEGYPKALP